MRMHIGRKAAAVGLAVAAVCGAAGTALAASGSSTATPSATSTRSASTVKADAVPTAGAQPTLTKMTMAQLAEKLGVAKPMMIKALDDMKGGAVGNPYVNKSNVDLYMAKIMAVDLGIGVPTAQWAVAEITGGYVPTNIDWGFGK